MADILFGQSYFLSFDAKMQRMGQPYPPLGTLYAAAAVRSRGYGVALFDATLAPSVDAWEEALETHRPRYAVIYEDQFNYFSKMCLTRMRDAAFDMIARARSRGCRVVVSGSDATDRADDYHRAGAEFLIIGEGEETLPELIDSLESRTPTAPGDIPGLSISNIALHPAPRGLISDLDELPATAWDLVDLDLYRAYWRGRHGYHSMNMVTTRGCPYRCNWCAKPVYGRRYTVRSPEGVAGELLRLKQDYRPDHIWFGDDIFGLKPGWIRRFADRVQDLGAAMPFKCQMRADLIDRDTATSLKEAGCRTVWMGAESGSQAVLDRMDKDLKVDQIETAAYWLRSAGIEVCFFLQFGYPGEGWADILATLQLVRRCRPDDIGISVSYPLPGTAFHARIERELGEKRNWSDSGDLAMLYRGTYAPGFYRQAYRTTHRLFRLQRAIRSHRSQVPGHESGAFGPTARSLRLRTISRRFASAGLNAALLPFSWARLLWLRRKPNRPTFTNAGM